MKTKLISLFLVLVIMLIGCGEDTSVTDPGGGDSNSSKMTLSGSKSGSYDVEVGMLNVGDGVAISLDAKEENKALMISSSLVKSGTFNIPDEYSATYTDVPANKIYEFGSGSVKINSISGTNVSGSVTCSGYGLDLTTFETDSTKLLTITAEFTL